MDGSDGREPAYMWIGMETRGACSAASSRTS